MTPHPLQVEAPPPPHLLLDPTLFGLLVYGVALCLLVGLATLVLSPEEWH